MLRREHRLQPNASSALWLPFLWIFFACSRFPAQWLVVLGVPTGAFGPSADGTPIDAAIFLSMTLLGLRVLSRRGFSLREFNFENRWIALFFFFALFAILWSEMPFISFKRWVKILAHPVMALVILTDPDPVAAIRLVFRKVAILVLPLSLLFVRYYPAIGRSYDYWTGVPFTSGVTTIKNTLGCVCFIFAVFFLWELVAAWKVKDRATRRAQLITGAGFLVLALYLLHLARSATSQVCFILGAITIVGLSTRAINPRYIGTTLVGLIAVGLTGDALFGLRDAIIRMLGRRPDLTDRTHLWEALSGIPINPFFGAGFESFWMGERMAALTANGYGFGQAHNGYLETYLNLGVVGLSILVISIIVGFHKIRADLIKHPMLGRLELAFLLAIIAYNYTEAAFKANQPLWTIFCIIAIRCDSYRQRLLSRTNLSPARFAVPQMREPMPVGAGYGGDRWRSATL